MMNMNRQKNRQTAATVSAWESGARAVRRVWRWLTAYNLSPDEVIRMSLLYTEIL